MASGMKSPCKEDETDEDSDVPSLVHLCLCQAEHLPKVRSSLAGVPKSIIHRLFRAMVETKSLNSDTVRLFRDAECWVARLSPHYCFHEFSNEMLEILASLRSLRLLDVWNCHLPAEVMETIGRQSMLNTLMVTRMSAKSGLGNSEGGEKREEEDPAKLTLTYLSVIQSLTSLTNLSVGHMDTIDIAMLTSLQQLQELHIVASSTVHNPDCLTSFQHLRTFQYSDSWVYKPFSAVDTKVEEWKQTLKVIFSLSQLSCLILTKVFMKDDYIDFMGDFPSLRYLDVSFTGLTAGGLFLMLAHTPKLTRCTCVGIKLPSELTVSDLFAGAPPPNVEVVSNRSSIVELLDLVSVHQRAVKTCESLVDLISKECHARGCNIYQPTAQAIEENLSPVKHYQYLLKMMMYNTGSNRVCMSTLRLLRPPENPSDEFLDKLGSKEMFDAIIHTMASTKSTDVMDSCVQVLHPLFQSTNVVLRFLKCNSYVSPIVTALENFGSSHMMLGLNICVILFLLGKPFDEPMMDSYIQQGAVRILVAMLDKLGVTNGTVAKKVCLALSVLANTSQQAKHFLHDGGLRAFSDLFNSPESLACYMSSRGIGFLAREEGMVKPICEAGLIPKLIQELRATSSPSQSDFACWALKALLEYKVARIDARRHPDFLDALLHLIVSGSQYCKDRCSEILLELSREEESFVAIGRKMIPHIIGVVNENEGNSDLVQRLLLNLANLVKGCTKNQELLFELAGQNIYDLALEDSCPHLQDQCLLTIWSMCSNNKKIQAQFRQRQGMELLTTTMAKFSQQRFIKDLKRITETENEPTAGEVAVHVSQRVLDVLCNFLGSAVNKVAFVRGHNRQNQGSKLLRDDTALVQALYDYQMSPTEIGKLCGVPLLVSLIDDGDKDVRMFAIYALTLLAENDTTQAYVVRCGLYRHLFRIWMTDHSPSGTLSEKEKEKEKEKEGGDEDLDLSAADSAVEKMKLRAVKMKRTDHEVGNVAYVLRHVLREDPNFWHPMASVGLQELLNTVISVCKSNRSLYAKRHSLLTFSAILSTSNVLRQMLLERHEVVEAIVDMMFESVENYDSLSSSCSDLFSKGVKVDQTTFKPILNDVLVLALHSKLKEFHGPNNLPLMQKIFGFIGRLVSEPPVASVLAQSSLYSMYMEGFQACPQQSCQYLDGACELAKHSEFHQSMTQEESLKAVTHIIMMAAKQHSLPNVVVVMYHGSLKEENIPGLMAVKLIEKLIEKMPDCISKVIDLGLLDVFSSSFLIPPNSAEFRPQSSSLAMKRTYAVSPTSVAFWEVLTYLVGMVLMKNTKLELDVKELDLVKHCYSELQELQTTLGDRKNQLVVYKDAVAIHGLQALNGLLTSTDVSLQFLNENEVCCQVMPVIMDYAFKVEKSHCPGDHCVFSEQSRSFVNSVCMTRQGRSYITTMTSSYFGRIKGIKDLLSICGGFSDHLRCAVANAGLLVRFSSEAVILSNDPQQQELVIALAEVLLQYGDVSQDDLLDELRDAWMKPFHLTSDQSTATNATHATCVVPSNVLESLEGLDVKHKDDIQYSALNLILMLLSIRDFDTLPIADQDAVREKVNEKEKKKPELDTSTDPLDSEQKAPWPWRLRSVIFQILAQLLKKPKDEQKQKNDKNEAKTSSTQEEVRDEKDKTNEMIDGLQGNERVDESSDMQNDIQPDINYSPRQDQLPNRLNDDSLVESEDPDDTLCNSNSPLCINLLSTNTDSTTIHAKAIQGSRESLSTAISRDMGSQERSSGSDSKSEDKSSIILKDPDSPDMSQSLKLFKGVTVDYFKDLFSPLEQGMILPDLKTLYVVSMAESVCNQSNRADNLMRDILVDASWLESAREIAKYYDDNFEVLELEPERLIRKAKLKEEAKISNSNVNNQDDEQVDSSDIDIVQAEQKGESQVANDVETIQTTSDEVTVDDSLNAMAVAARQDNCTVGVGLAKAGWLVLGLADPAAVGVRVIPKQDSTSQDNNAMKEVTNSPAVKGEEMVEGISSTTEVELHHRILKNCLDSLVELAHISNLRSHFWSSSLPDQLQSLASHLISCTDPRRIDYDPKAEELAFESLNDEEQPMQSPKSVRHTLLTNISSVFWDLSAGGYKAGRELHQQEILPLLLDLIDYNEEYVQKAGAATLVNTSINSLKFGAQCRSHPGFLERVLGAWKRSVNSDALNKKIAWTLNRIGWDFYPYCTYVALHGGLSTVLELAFMNEVIEDEMLADILDTTHMMLWIPHWSCQLSLETYGDSSSIDSDTKLDNVDNPEMFTVISEQTIQYLGRLQLKTVLRLLELVDEPLHVAARQSLLHILCLMGIRERCVAEVFMVHFLHHPIHYTVANAIHAGYLRLVPHLMGVECGQTTFTRAKFIEKHLMPFKTSLTIETPIASRVIRVLIVLTNHCAWMAEELVNVGCFEVMTKHLDMLSVDNIADYSQIIAMVLVQYEPSLSVFEDNVKLEFLSKLIEDEDVEKRCSAVKLLSAVSGKVPEALTIMRETGVEKMFEVIGSNEDLRHKYLACNAILSVTDYGDYNLTDLVTPKAKVLYDTGMSARHNYTELFEGVMDVLQVLLHTLSGEEKNQVGDLFPLRELTELFVDTHIWTYYVFLSLLFSELATMGDPYRDPIRENTVMVEKCANLLQTTTNVYLQLHMTWLLSSLAFDQPWAADLIYCERGFQFVLNCLFVIKDMDHYAVVLYGTAHIAANDPTDRCCRELVEAGGVEVICDTLMNNPNLYLQLSASFSLKRLWECCPLTRPKISAFRDANREYVESLRSSAYRLYRQFVAALDE